MSNARRTLDFLRRVRQGLSDKKKFESAVALMKEKRDMDEKARVNAAQAVYDKNRSHPPSRWVKKAPGSDDIVNVLTGEVMGEKNHE